MHGPGTCYRHMLRARRRAAGGGSFENAVGAACCMHVCLAAGAAQVHMCAAHSCCLPRLSAAQLWREGLWVSGGGAERDDAM